MTLIDRKGARRRPICRECRKLHSRKDCPKSFEAALRRNANSLYRRALAVQGELQQRRAI